MTLQLPDFSPKLKKVNNELWIFCIIRKKYLILTPEEWVRQQIINLLITEYNYPKGLINVESALNYNQKQKRSDILVYDKETNPFLLIECKSNKVEIDDTVLEQVFTYNYIIKSKYVAVSNGLEWFCFQKDEENNYVHKEIIPTFSV